MMAEKLHQGERLVVVAPRRFGKSSCLEMISRQLREHYLPLLVDVGACQSGPELVCTLLEAVVDQPDHGISLADYFRHPDLTHPQKRMQQRALGVVKARIKESWQEALGDLLRAMDVRPGAPMLLLLDEFAWMVESLMKQGGTKDCKAVMAILNGMQSQRLRITISGSVYLDHFLRAHHLPRLEGWQDVRLPPWQDEEPELMVRALAMGGGLVLGEDVVEFVLEEAGVVVPFFLQKLLHELNTATQSGGKPAALVREVQAQMAERRKDNPYQDLLEHLQRYAEYLGTDHALAAAETVLDRASSPGGADQLKTRQEVRRQLTRGGRASNPQEEQLLLDMLGHDFYLYSPGPDVLAFRCPAIRRWWRISRRL